MKKFNRGGNFPRKNSGGHGFNRNNDSSRPEMFKAICADCGAPCEVPFKPSGNRPVLCSNCFKGKDERVGSSRPAGRDFGRSSSFGDKPKFKATCAQCCAPCEVPFKPTGDRPIFCSHCFSEQGEGGRSNDSRGHNHDRAQSSSQPTQDQFAILNAKLDKIIKSLNLNVAPAAPLKSIVSDGSLKIEPVKEEKKVVKAVVIKAPKKVTKAKAAVKKITKKK